MQRASARPASVSPAKARRWTELLIDTDRQYFTAGATSQRIAGTELVVLPGLERYLAGAVAFVDDALPLLFRPRAWRDAMVALCEAEGASQVRVYTPATDPRVSVALRAAGLSSSIEIAMAGYTERIGAGDEAEIAGFRIREISTPEDWQTKHRLHERTPERPDGKAIDAGAWMQLERCKVEASYMSAWLIERDGEACGAFGLSFRPEMVRFKNFFVVPEHRRRGAAAAAVCLMAKEAHTRGIQALGCFAFPGGAGARVYERSGLARVGEQIEWTLSLAELAVDPRARAHDARR